MTTTSNGTHAWWRTAVIYEIYPRSFMDANGDGEGDLAGITRRLPYLRDLGVDAVWIAPWYPSPLADGGYDVTDYCDIHPMLGDLDDAQAMIAEAHRLGLRVLIDLVANHTSHEHPWFREALAAPPGSAPRSRYHFREGRGPGGDEPPNNWISAFGGPAWSRVPDGSGQWYLHTFAPEQPDLNWDDAGVQDAFDDVLRFWLERDVDGFRVDAAPAMAKKPGLPDAVYDDDGRFAASDWVDNPHWDVDTVHEIFRRWRGLLDRHPGDQVFVAESVVNGPERLSQYLRPDELHTAFNFGYVHARWDPAALRSVIDETLAALAPIGAPATWALSSHDEVRHLTRFGRTDARASLGSAPGQPSDLDLGRRRARAAVLLTLALPGGCYLYQGEELGLPEVEDLPDSVLQDPVFSRSGGLVRGRDGCRVPIPWSGTAPPFGFSPDGVGPWLPQPASWADLTMEAQQQDPGSMLSLYRRALELRRELTDLADPGLSWLPAPDGVLRFLRGERFECIVNMSGTDQPLDSTPLLSSTDRESSGTLAPDAAAWIIHEPRA